MPLTFPGQNTLDARIEVSPHASIFRYRDYWGARVVAFDIQDQHDELAVAATSLVETSPPIAPPAGLSWAELAAPVVADRWVEYTIPTARTRPDAELATIAADVTAGQDPATAARTLADWVRDTLEYVPGVTGVNTSAHEAWLDRRGVCQDIAHLTLLMLRARGLPARYVSGYVHPQGAAAEIGETRTGESHAWVEWWNGAWTAWDPTNGVPVGEQHVVVARGRDYDDVPPLKGIYSGPPSTSIGVTVEVTRMA